MNRQLGPYLSMERDFFQGPEEEIGEKIPDFPENCPREPDSGSDHSSFSKCYGISSR